MPDSIVRNYMPSDLDAVKRIHEASQIDYTMPNLNRFLVNKVLEIEGKVRASYGMQPCVENYLWLDKSDWADPEQKWVAIKVLDNEATEAVAHLGIDNILCCLPPGFQRFGKRISGKDGIGFKKLRPEWVVYAKHAGDGNENQ